MSQGYVKGMLKVFKNYVQYHTKAIFKLYVIYISVLCILIRNAIFAGQMEPLHSIFKSYVVVVEVNFREMK